MWYKYDIDHSQLIITCSSVGSDHLPVVLLYLEDQGLITRWKKIGVMLRLPHSDLEVIKRNQPDEEERLMAMLDQWLTSGRATKEALVDVLQTLR